MSRIGIAIQRREAAAVVTGRAGQVAWQWRQAVDAGQAPAQALREVLAMVPRDLRSGEVRLALSPRWLACADLVETPYRSEGQIEAIAASLAEGRCAGESAEELAIDVTRLGGATNGSLVAVHAIRQSLADELRQVAGDAWPRARLVLLASTVAALAGACSRKHGDTALAIQAGGEGLLIAFGKASPTAWRSFPTDLQGPDALNEWPCIAATMGIAADKLLVRAEGATAPLDLDGKHLVEPGMAAAVAACLADPERGVNLLRGMAGAPRSLEARLGGALRVLAFAAALALAAGAWLFHVEAGASRQVLEYAARCEEALWKETFPDKPYRPGHLAQEMNARFAHHRENEEANALPSALRFWSEVGACLPNADAMGFTLESLQLGPDGGRMAASLEARGGDPLQQAARLERDLNASERLVARGEFETKDKEVQVRMRLDYRPPQQTDHGAPPERPQAEGAR